MMLDKEGRTPEENEKSAEQLRLARIKRVLASDDWTVFVEHFQAAIHSLLERVLYCKSEELELTRAALRAHIEAVRDFGVQDLLVEGRIIELDKVIKNVRRDVRAQVQASYAGVEEES